MFIEHPPEMLAIPGGCTAETLWHDLRLETTPMADWHPLGKPLDRKTLDRIFAPFARRMYLISY
jgi:hypothetical protein